MYRINIKNAAYALLTKDDATGTTYSAVKFLPELRSIKMSPNVVSGSIYGDGVKKDLQSMIESVDVNVEINKIPLENRAEMLGIAYDKGVINEKGTESAPYIAFGFEIEHDDKKSEFIWLVKGKIEPISDDLKQREGKFEYSTQSAKFTFIPRVKDGMLRKMADSGATDFVATVATNWFTAVPVPV